MMSETLVARDLAEHTAFAADLVARAVSEAVDRRGVARVALSGGGTPADTYRAVARLALPWDRVSWFWVDERAVPPDHPRSNYGAAARELGIGGDEHGRAFRMEAEGDLDAAAAAYQVLLRKAFGVASSVSFDVMVMGVGDDGHTASLFPGTGAVHIEDRLVAAIPAQPEKKLEARLTLTAPVILEARQILILARGAQKRRPIALAKGPGSEDEVPSRLFQRARGSVVWLLDEEAAGPWSIEPPPPAPSSKLPPPRSNRPGPGR